MARLQKWTLNNDDLAATVVVYGRTENWNFFVNTDVTDELQDCYTGSTTDTAAVKSHTRRKYPGDTNPVTVAAQPEGRRILTGVTRSSGNALPGRTVILATDPDTWDGGDEKRQFQYVGDFKDLYMHLAGDAEKDIIVTNSTGTRYRICATIDNGGE